MMTEGKENKFEQKEPPTPKPSLLDVVMIDGRLAQVRPSKSTIAFLNEFLPSGMLDRANITNIDWNDYDYEPIEDCRAVRDLRKNGQISDKEYMAVRYGPEQEHNPNFRDHVVFFGRYTKKK